MRPARLALALALPFMLAAAVALAQGGTTTAECAGGASGPEGASGKDAPFVREDVRALGDLLTCYCGCPHLQVSKCFCGTADEIRNDFAMRLDRGETPEAIAAAYVAEHGASILAVPPKSGFHWIIWVGPPALLAFGALVVLATGRRWSRLKSGPEVAPAPLDPEVEKRLRAELERAVEERT